jgi:hypothetical protein
MEFEYRSLSVVIIPQVEWEGDEEGQGQDEDLDVEVTSNHLVEVVPGIRLRTQIAFAQV